MCIYDCVFNKIEESGCFGPGSKVVSYKNDPNKKGVDQFASVVKFVRFTVDIKNVLCEIDTVLKCSIQNKIYSELIGLKIQFTNEMIMYTKILPIINTNNLIEELFPKYYSGFIDTNNEDSIDYILLEDLSKKNYRLTSEKVFLDYDHCVLALQEIGKFHALSYAAKKRCPADFFSVVSSLREIRNNAQLENWKYKFLLCCQRGILPIIEEKNSVQLLEKYMKNYEDPVKFYYSLVNPVEPEAVVCHGDFCRNNMFFCYDDNLKPVSVKFFDLQTARYSSPVTDLSFFLFMNTNKETREKHWDEFLNIYQTSVESFIPDIEVPKLDFKRVAVFGYLHSSFFLPMMLKPISPEEDDFDSFLKLTPYQQGEVLSKRGGENETQVLVDIVKFLLKKGYIQENYF